MKKLVTIAVFSLATIALIVGLAAHPTDAADHLDAPGLTSPGGDGRLDINDIYAFKNGSNTVLIMTVNPAAGVFSPLTFHPEASYDFLIDTNGDAKEDLTYKITFSESDDGLQEVMFRRIPGKGGAVLAKGQTGQNINVEGGGMLRADLFDDPFFFDLNAFLGAYAFCNAPGGPAGDSGANFFAGLNVSAIVLEVPSDTFGASNIGVWARTELDGQVDRMGRPAINTVFIPSTSKNAYNEGKPRHDQRDFSQFLGDFALVLLPDILTVDTSDSSGFLNGRQLADDVIDLELQIITGDANAGDCVDGNDVAFLTNFPYLAPAH
jgi:hypothetical protein